MNLEIIHLFNYTTNIVEGEGLNQSTVTVYPMPEASF